MDILIRAFPVVLAAAAVAQYGGYEGHGLEGHAGHGLEGHAGHGLEGHAGHGFAGYRGHSDHSLDGHGDHGEGYELDYHAHPKYSFDYSVKDPHTGDDKDHWETRDGDKVKGTYTLLETDGTKRVVEYEADDKHGFNAVVHKIGTPKHDPPQHKEREYYVKEPAYQPQSEEAAYGHEYAFDEGFVPSFGH